MSTGDSPLILVADDQLSMRQLIYAELKHAGYGRFAEAENGHVATEKILIDPPALIMLSADMPVMGGLELLEKIRSSANTAHIPVILTISGADMEFVTRARVLGVYCCLIKPFTPAQLAERVRGALASATIQFAKSA